MTRNLLFVRLKWFTIFKGFLIFVVGVGLSGCAPPSTNGLKSTPCTPQAPSTNIYRATPQPLTGAIFQYAATPLPPNTTSQEQQILQARYASFQYLINKAKQWSDVETIKLDTSSEAQIVFTFIGPQLIRAIYLSEVLKSRSFVQDFEIKTQSVLESIALRDELIFFVTVIATNNNNINTTSHKVDIPVGQMTLMNTEDLQVVPNHDDHILDQPINTSLEPVFGYIAYPYAVMNGTNCRWILDPIYNKSITLTVPEVTVDGITKSGPYTWVIPYASLVQSDFPKDLPMFNVPSDYDSNLISTLPKPPGPMISIFTPNGLDENTYWQNYARFLWYQITLENN